MQKYFFFLPETGSVYIYTKLPHVVLDGFSVTNLTFSIKKLSLGFLNSQLCSLKFHTEIIFCHWLIHVTYISLGSLNPPRWNSCPSWMNGLRFLPEWDLPCIHFWDNRQSFAQPTEVICPSAYFLGASWEQTVHVLPTSAEHKIIFYCEESLTWLVKHTYAWGPGWKIKSLQSGPSYVQMPCWPPDPEIEGYVCKWIWMRAIVRLVINGDKGN